ncbi:MAG: hypothetical protein AB7O47_11035 [Flavobacteriales bacterium]
MPKFLHIILLVLSSSFLYSQEKGLEDYEKELNQLSIDIVSEANDETKQKVNTEFQTLLKEAIELSGSFDFPFKNIRAISILKSNDKIKIYNWALPFEDETYQYFALVQIKLNKGEYKIVELVDRSAELKKPEFQTLTDKTWFGALYYEIIHNKKLGNDTYTLLGWDGDYNLTNKKIIDVMTVNKNGTIKFGSSIFKMDKKVQKRVIFTYAETAVMSLKYDVKTQLIIFDYLVPTSSNLDGVFEYYGPSLNRFDGFIVNKNKWEYQKDVDIQQSKNLKDRFYNSPN